jgi:hypothetical protein
VPTYGEVFEFAAWAAFLVIGTLLWLAGIRLFLNSKISRRKKILWPLFLVSLGLGIGSLLPLASIRNKCLLLFAVLPALAVVDIKLARSNRTFSFWLQACAFEVYTVFATTVITRVVLGAH